MSLSDKIYDKKFELIRPTLEKNINNRMLHRNNIVNVTQRRVFMKEKHVTP